MEVHASCVAEISQTLQVGQNHLPDGIRGEEGCPLGTPVIVEHNAVHGEILAVVGDECLIHIAQLGEQGVDGILLVIVDDGHGGAFKVHEGDQTLKQAVLEADLERALAALEALICLGPAFPVQCVHIGELDDVGPVIHILQGGLAGLDHGAAGGRNEYPLNAEQVGAALLLLGQQGSQVHDLRTGNVVDVDPALDIQDVREGGDPHHFAVPLQGGQEILSGGDGGVFLGGAAAKEVHHQRTGMLADNLQFVLGKDLFHRGILLSFSIAPANNGNRF